MTDSRLEQIDAKIATEHDLYLRQMWAGNDVEAKEHSARVDALLEFRTYCQRHPGRLTTA